MTDNKFIADDGFDEPWECELFLNDKPISLTDLMNANSNFKFEFKHDKYTGIGFRGDHALWFPINSNYGRKFVFYESRKPFTPDLKALNIIKDSNSPIFPKIYNFRLTEVWADHNHKALEIIMEPLNPYDKKSEKNKENDLTESSIEYSDLCSKEFERLNLIPDDHWYKKMNNASGKIIDFHEFRYNPSRYQFVSKVNAKELDSIYQSAFRWSTKKGTSEPVNQDDTLYQGFRFADCELPGYKSNGVDYDSYRKLPFIPFLNHVEGKKVLDLGCNEGFFANQCVIHGVKNIVAIDKDSRRLDFAQKISAVIGNQIEFRNEDISDYLKSIGDDKQFDLVLCLSVIHQMFPHLKGSYGFLEKLSKISELIILEIPYEHPKNKLNLMQTWKTIKDNFRIARLVYYYDDYSGSKRAIFCCYSKHHHSLKPADFK